MNKKILVTGMNKNQCTENFYMGQVLKVVPSHTSLLRCLRDMGYTVEQRYVKIGEDLSEYDDVIVFIHSPAGFARFAYNGLYAIAARPDCIIAYDDWQIDSIYDNIMALKDPEKLFRPYIFDSHDDIPANVRDYESQLLEAISIIASKGNRVMMSAFAGGHLGLLIDYPPHLLFSYNPNPYHINRKPGNYSDTGEANFFDEGEVAPEDKKKMFNFASLVQGKTAKWLKKQHITWPVQYFGSKKDNQIRLTEGEMCRVYAEQWGCLMPGYFHAGSGWWRARPLQVADAGSILIGDKEEMIIYYHDDYLAGLTASDIEAMDVTQLAATAAAQKEALYSSHPLDKYKQQIELVKILEAK